MLRCGTINEVLKQNSIPSNGNITIYWIPGCFRHNWKVARLWAWCFQIWREFCCGPHTTHVTITDDTHATVLQNVKQHSRKGDQGTWQVEFCSHAQYEMTKLEIKPFTLQCRPGPQWLFYIKKHEETDTFLDFGSKAVVNFNRVISQWFEEQEKYFNFSGISYLPQEGYQTHGGLHWETV